MPHYLAEPFALELKLALELSGLFCHISWRQKDGHYTEQKT